MPISKKIFSLVLIPVVLVLTAFCVVKPVNAAEFHFTDYSDNATEIIQDDLYISANTVDVKGLINGDLIVFAETVNISGTISGNVVVFANEITFTGSAYGNVFAVGRDISITGKISRDLTVVGSSVTVSNASVDMDVSAIAYDVSLSGTIKGDCRLVAQSISSSAIINEDLIAISQSKSLNDANVTGNVYTWETIKGIASEQGVVLEDNTEVEKRSSYNWGGRLLSALYSFVGLGIVGYVLIAGMPVKTGKLVSKITSDGKELLKSFGVGALILFVAPLGLLAITLTVAGIPLAFLIFAVLIFFTLFGKIWAEVALGQEVLGLCKVKGYRPFKSLLVGRGISVLIGLIPVIGFLYSLVLISLSLGAFTRMKIEYWNEAK